MPTPSTYSVNGMPMAPGSLAPGLNANGFISNIALLLRVVAKTSNYTVNLNESGTVFHTTGATAAVIFTLPAVASTSGHVYFFFNGADQSMTVTSAEGDNIIAFNDLDIDSVGFATTSEKIGGAVMMVGNGVNWLAFVMLGAETQTPSLTD